jgi:hypothetical protein
MARLQITDFEKWGKLVKAWATGAQTPPADVSGLKAQMAQAGAGTVPDEITSVRFMRPPGTPGTVVIWLPPSQAIQDMDANIARGAFAQYPLPPFYAGLFKDEESFRDALKNALTPDKFAKFNAERVGDYTINECQ